MYRNIELREVKHNQLALARCQNWLDRLFGHRGVGRTDKTIITADTINLDAQIRDEVKLVQARFSGVVAIVVLVVVLVNKCL